MDPRCGLFRNALEILDRLSEIARLLGDKRLQSALKFNFFFILWLAKGFAPFKLCAPQSEHGGITTIVEDDIRCRVVTPIKDATDIIPVIGKAFALYGKHRNVARCYGGRGMVLRREDVTRCPADVSSKRRQSFDENSRLNCHVKRTNDPRAL